MDERSPAIEAPIEAALGESAWLRRLARSLVRDAHRAEDAVQETLVAALERPEAGRSSLRGWLGTVLRNRVRQEERARARREGRERAPRAASTAPSAGETSERLELQALVLEAVRGLEEPYRTAIVQRFFDGRPPREIARALGIPVKTVNTRLERGLAKLRARLDGRFGGDRQAWLQGLLPLAGAPHALPWLSLTEGIAMGAKTKIAAAVVVLAGAGWLGRELVSDSRPSDGGRGEVVSASSTRSPGPSASEPRLDEPEPGVVAQADARGDAGVPAREALATPLEPAVRPQPARQATLLDVRVVKEGSGEPLAGASVEVQVLSGTTEAAGRAAPFYWSSAGADGRERIEVPPGKRLWITAGASEREPLDPVRRATIELEPLEAGEQRSLTIELAHGLDRTFYGQVVAAEDGRALAGALIVPQPRHEGSISLETDAAGHFEYPYPSWEPGEVLVRLEGYGSQVLRLGLLDQTRTEPHLVVLERAVTIAARVELPPGVAPVHLGVRSQSSAVSALLDSLGRGELGDLAAGIPLEVELRAGESLLWRELEPWTLAPGERRVLELDLRQGTLVHGYLRDREGLAVTDQEVWALAFDPDPARAPGAGHRRLFERDDRGRALVAQPDGRGRYEFAQLPPGWWWIGPGARDGDAGALAALASAVELLPGELSRWLDLEAPRGLWIRGRVLDPDGKPLGRMAVMATRPPDEGRLVLYADEEGTFALGPLAPGMHALRAFGDGIFGWGAPLEVAAGTDGVELRVGATNSIAGRVVDAEGRPADAHVHLLQRSGSLGQGTSQREQGGFLFIDLEPGTYTVQAEAPDGRVAILEAVLEEGQRITGLVVTLREGARIGVRHDLESYVRCSIWSNGVLAADSTVRAGVEAFETVPAGPIRVELYDGSGTLGEQELDARAGRVETVVFDL